MERNRSPEAWAEYDDDEMQPPILWLVCILLAAMVGALIDYEIEGITEFGKSLMFWKR